MLSCLMLYTVMHQTSSPRIVVVASSIEAIDELARFLCQFHSSFSVPLVVHLQGLKKGSIGRLTHANWGYESKLEVVYAQDGEVIRAGYVYVSPVKEQLVFIDVGILGFAPVFAKPSSDRLFESAAQWYGSGVIGIVLSGMGKDGTSGLRAITKVDGVRMVQTPLEAEFSDMPMNALLGDDVQHAVLLDHMGTLLSKLVAEPDPARLISPEIQAEVERRVLSASSDLAKSLDRSIKDILKVIREELVMDVTFFSKQSGDDVVVSHSTFGPDELRLQGLMHPRHKGFFERVLDGRLPSVMPDLKAWRAMHDVPVVSIPVGAYMATPVWLRDGTLYGMLCCLNSTASPEIDQCHYGRLQMSARLISKLVQETGETLQSL